MGDALPAGAVGAFVGVLVYSLICLTLCTMVVGLLFSYGEKWTYITMLATFSAISTLMSMIQQIHYATCWRSVKVAQYDKAIQSQTIKGAGLQGAAGEADIVLYNIQFYCYNVMALSVLWWAVALFCGSWGVRGNFLGTHAERVSPASKIFSIVWPGFIIGVSNVPGIIKTLWLTFSNPTKFNLLIYMAQKENAELFFVLNNITIFLSLSVGSILLILTLYKYMKTRRLVMGSNSGRRGGWWGPSSENSNIRSQTMESGNGQTKVMSEKRRSIYDRALLIRFTIGFTILAIFEVAIIVFSVFQIHSFASLVATGTPNFEVGNAITDILFFIPGVTSSMVVYLVFGTTKSYKQYAELLLGCCGLRQKIQHRRKPEPGAPRALEFDRLESIPNKPSKPITGDEDDVQRRKELESRVRYFSTLSSESISRTSLDSEPMPNRQSGMREAVELNIKMNRQPSVAASTVVSIGFIDGRELGYIPPVPIRE